ncbi:MAG: PfkB family carbohydrate kinase, partial [Carboxylicivirga sp.]|nr:PfkB family carbohydrate kinase [Carboxylicivirga sp.]
QHYKVPIIDPVSTIGAGDNFNAGIIKALLECDIYKSDELVLSHSDWLNIAAYGIEFSSEVCMLIDNYVNTDFKARLSVNIDKRIQSVN